MRFRTVLWIIAMLCSPLSFGAIYALLIAGTDLIYYGLEHFRMVNENVDSVFLGVMPIISFGGALLGTSFLFVACLIKICED